MQTAIPHSLNRDPSFDDLRELHPLARLAALVVAAGDHSLLMVGAPGVGKTMIVRRIAALRPDLPPDLAGDVQIVHALARTPYRDESSPPIDLANRRPPLRMPHHTVSVTGMIGSVLRFAEEIDKLGKRMRRPTTARPGELALANGGILFLDELPEFSRACLDATATARARADVTVASLAGAWPMPAAFALVAASAPCPCGYYGTTDRECLCPAVSVQRYRQRIAAAGSFDLTIEISRGALDGAPEPAIASEPHGALARRVAAARRALGRDRRDAPQASAETLRATLAALGIPEREIPALASWLRGGWR